MTLTVPTFEIHDTGKHSYPVTLAAAAAWACYVYLNKPSVHKWGNVLTFNPPGHPCRLRVLINVDSEDPRTTWDVDNILAAAWITNTDGEFEEPLPEEIVVTWGEFLGWIRGLHRRYGPKLYPEIGNWSNLKLWEAPLESSRREVFESWLPVANTSEVEGARMYMETGT